MILGLQEPIHGIRQKHTKDATQMHRISNPTSHLQRRAHKSEKTNEQSPSIDVILKRAHLAVTHPKAAEKGGQVGPAEPLVRPNQDGFPAPSALEGRLPPPSQRRLSTFPHLSQQETYLFTLYKGLHTPSQGNPFSLILIHKEEK